MELILIGAPGSGKGTLADGLIKKYHIPEISSGEILRKVASENTELGQRVKEMLEKGIFAPDNMIISLVARRIAMPDCKQGFILDGFPRNISQAKALDKVTNIRTVIKLNVLEKTVIERLSGRLTCRECGTVFHKKFNPPKNSSKCDSCGGELYQRSDDTPPAIKTRLEKFMEQTKPLIDYYSAQGRLLEVNAEQQIKKIQEDVINSLEAKKSLV